MNPNWNQLDEDLADMVFARLEGRDLARARLPCSRWARVVKETARHLNLRGEHIKRSFHESFPNLKTLSVVGNVSDATLVNISNSRRLEHVELYDRAGGASLSREAVSALASIPSLCSLDVYSCSPFTDANIDVFGPMMAINMFSIRDTHVEFLPDTLSYFRASVSLDVTGIRAFAGIRYLQWLDIGYSTDTHPGWLEPLSELRLRVLCVNDCDYSDIASISGMTTLEALDMNDTGVTPGDLTALGTLVNLTRLDIAYCRCRYTQRSGLPEVIEKLQRLRYLNIYDTCAITVQSDFVPYAAKPHGLLVSRKNSVLEVLVAGERDLILEDMSRLPMSLSRLEIRGANIRSGVIGYIMATLPWLSYIDMRFVENVSMSDLYKVPKRIEYLVTNKKMLQRFIEDNYPRVYYDPLSKDESTGMPHDLLF